MPLSLLDPNAWAFWRKSASSSGIRREAGIQQEGPSTTFAVPKYPVTADTAMQISAVWAAVQLKSTILGSLDLHFHRMTGSGRVAVLDHALARLFRGRVNRYQNRVEFFETLGLNLYLTGNAFCLIQRNGAEIVGLLPLMSAQVEVELMRDGSLVYTYRDGAENVRVYSPENVWHLKLPGNGMIGMSPLDYARNSISLAIAGEDWASRLVGNGGKPTGVLMYDRILSTEQREQIREKFKDLREGTAEALVVLEAGMKYEQVSLSPQDVQLLQARRFQIEDIARFFNVPSVLINDTSGSTVWGSGIEQIITGWYKLGFRPELERIEQSIVANLLTEIERETISVEFDFEELLRTDFNTRVTTGAKAVNAGLMTRNEWRKREWLPEMPGADELTAQVNLTNLDDLPKATGGKVINDAED
jgi:HK97 family phage portal protein